MTRTVFQLRVPLAERQEWDWAAAQSNESVSAWLRRLAREDLEARRAEEKERNDRVAQREELLRLAFPGSDFD